MPRSRGTHRSLGLAGRWYLGGQSERKAQAFGVHALPAVWPQLRSALRGLHPQQWNLKPVQRQTHRNPAEQGIVRAARIHSQLGQGLLQ